MAEPEEEGGDAVPQEAEEVAQDPPTLMRVKVLGVRGCPEDAEPVTASYSYDVSKWKTGDEEAEEDKAWTGESEPAPEGGIEQAVTLEGEHALPSDPEQLAALLLDLVRQPMQFKVGGLAAGGAVLDVPLVDLVWLPPRNPDDDEDVPRLPTLEGWFKVKPDGEEVEGFPEGIEINISIILSKIILDEDEIKDANVIDVCVKNLHQLPSAWMLNDGDDPEEHKYAYTLRYSLPGASKMTEVTVEPGTVIAKAVPPEPDVPAEEDGEQKEAAGEEGEEVEKQEQAEVVTPEVEEIFKLQQTDRQVSSIDAKKEQRIEFNHTHSQFLLPSATNKLKQSFLDRHLFPIEISRTLKDGSDYVYEKKYHGLAQLEIKKIADEDVTFISVRCPVGPHHDFQTLTAEELEALPEDDREEEEMLHDGTAANPYLLAETYIHVEIKMQVPISPKPPPPPEPLAAVRDIIPKRAPVSKHTPEHQGVDKFRQDIRIVLAELRDLFADKSLPLDSNASPEQLEARRTQLLCYLSETGKMHEFKTKLKQSVSLIMREKFKQPGSLGESTPDAASIISDLNSALKDEINALLYKEFPAKRPPGGASDEFDSLTLVLDKEKRLSEEAVVNLDYVKAIRHLNRRIVSSTTADPRYAQLWFELGSTVIQSGDVAKAQECFKQALAVDPAHVLALLALGVLFTVRDKFAEAESFFKESVTSSPNNVLAWSCNILFFDLESRDLERRTSLKQMEAVSKKDKAKASKKSPYLRASEFCLEMGSTQLVERAMTQELHRFGDSAELQVMLGRAYLMNTQYDKCRQHLQAALQIDKKCTVAMTLIGHSHFMEHGWPHHRADMPIPHCKDAMAFYEKAINTKPVHIETLQYIRIIKFQIASKKWAEAAETAKKAVAFEPSTTAWLGRAIAMYYLQDYERAEQALQEAIILDDHNPEVWAASAIVSLLQSTSHPGAQEGVYQPKAAEAVSCLQRALKAGLSTAETFPTHECLLQQAGDLFLRISYYDSAAAAYRRALATTTGLEAIAAINKSLAESCVAMDDKPAAVEAYKKFGSLTDVKSDWELALKELIKLSEGNRTAAKKYQDLLSKDVWVKRQPLP